MRGEQGCVSQDAAPHDVDIMAYISVEPLNSAQESSMVSGNFAELVHIPVDSVTLEGMLVIPPGAQCVVIFAHGSGSSRHSPRNTLSRRSCSEPGWARYCWTC